MALTYNLVQADDKRGPQQSEAQPFRCLKLGWIASITCSGVNPDSHRYAVMQELGLPQSKTVAQVSPAELDGKRQSGSWLEFHLLGQNCVHCCAPDVCHLAGTGERQEAATALRVATHPPPPASDGVPGRHLCHTRAGENPPQSDDGLHQQAG